MDSITCKFNIKTVKENFPLFLKGLEAGSIEINETPSDFQTWKEKIVEIIYVKNVEKQDIHNRESLSFEELFKESEIKEKINLELILTSLKDEGEIYEPEPGVYRLL